MLITVNIGRFICTGWLTLGGHWWKLNRFETPTAKNQFRFSKLSLSVFYFIGSRVEFDICTISCRNCSRKYCRNFVTIYHQYPDQQGIPCSKLQRLRPIWRQKDKFTRKIFMGTKFRDINAVASFFKQFLYPRLRSMLSIYLTSFFFCLCWPNFGLFFRCILDRTKYHSLHTVLQV